MTKKKTQMRRGKRLANIRFIYMFIYDASMRGALLFLLLISLLAIPVLGTVILEPEVLTQGGIGNLTELWVGNLTVYDQYMNVTVVNYNVTGDIDVNGNLQ